MPVGLGNAVLIAMALMVPSMVASYLHGGSGLGLQVLKALVLIIIPASALYGVRLEPLDRDVLLAFRGKFKRW